MSQPGTNQQQNMRRNHPRLIFGGGGKHPGLAGEETHEPIRQHPDQLHLLLMITQAVPPIRILE